MSHRKKSKEFRTLSREQAEKIADDILRRFDGRPREYTMFVGALDVIIDIARRRF